MAEKRTTTLWRVAKPISRAWKELASHEQQVRHDALGDWWKPSGEPLATTDSPPWVRAVGWLTETSTRYQAAKQSEADMKASLIERIESGEFELLGYRLAPSKSQEPVEIRNPDLRKYEPDWADETVEIRGENFSDLRVSRSADRPTGRKRGRPGSNDAIIRAIDELIELGNPDFCKMPRLLACERIREKLRSDGADNSQPGNGLSDPNLQKLILQRCPKRKLK